MKKTALFLDFVEFRLFRIMVFLLIVLFSASFSLFSQALGDVNNDNVVDIVDALLVAQYYVGLNPPAIINLDAANVNCDTSTDIVDALLIAQYYVGMVTEFPCPTTPNPTTVPTAIPIPTQEVTPAPTPDPTETPVPGQADLTILYKNREINTTALACGLQPNTKNLYIS